MAKPEATPGFPGQWLLPPKAHIEGCTISCEFPFLQMLGKPLQILAAVFLGLAAVRAFAGSALRMSNLSSNLWE
jgi:hypothetical protein